MTKSIWSAHAAAGEFPALEQDIEVDVAIVGGGITGITTACLLAKSGMKVAVLESGRVGEGTSGSSTGNLYTMVDKRLHHIQSKWDKKTAGIVAESRTAAMNLIADLVAEYNIDCAFKRVPWYLFSETDKKDATIEKEKQAAADYGLEIEELQELPVPVKVSRALKVENQAQFNPAAFVKGLAGKIASENCQIYEQSSVYDIKKGDKKQVLTSGGKVTAGKVVLATHTPKGVYGVQTAIYPYREYAVAAKLKDSAENIPEGIFWDTEAKFHHSLRSYKADDGNYVLVVGGHHKVGQSDDYERFYQKLEENARRFFDVDEVQYKWSAQHYKPADGLPYIGESIHENIYLATGFSTDGLTYGAMSAMILNDIFNARENPWAETYKLKRFTPQKSAKEYIKGNINVMKQYLEVFPGQSEAEAFSEVKPGEGKVVEKGTAKFAVYKDETGKAECVSAFCTHLGCVVDWNEAEKSWDCPCHGSRFETNGKVIEGPAYEPLAQKRPEGL